MECCYHDRFYNLQLNISIFDLINSKQLANESIVEFLERFRQMRSKCNVLFPELEYTIIAIGNMIAQLQNDCLHKIV